ncbi:hypothetical protein WISP_127776 [Willisornis vidua]|uniref:Uncharacterized protein n=1 Tax=Willisornis vidua TaxID=1566151 RepID=A0ABQ9CQJ7_9PASS|nr:hypothetical protein WISP_127776 [Willisornis vidua]
MSSVASSVEKQEPQIRTYGPEKRTVRWIENWLNFGDQSSVIQQHKDELEANPQQSSPGVNTRAILFNIFINDEDQGTEYPLSKFADHDAVQEWVGNTPDGCAAIQRDDNRLEKWAKRSLMELNKVLHLQRYNTQARVYTCLLESSSEEKDIRLDCIRHSVANRLREVNLHLYSALVTQLEC